jgi:hypothetical protein
VIYIVWLCVVVGDVNATRDHMSVVRVRQIPAGNFEPVGQQRVAVIGDSAIAISARCCQYCYIVSSRHQFCVIVCQLVPSRRCIPI